MKNVIKPFSRNILIPLGLAAEASTADAVIHKKIRIWIYNTSNIEWWNGGYYKNN